MLTFNVTPEGQSLLNNATAGSSPLIIDGVSFYHNDRRIKTIKSTVKGCSFNDGNGIGEYVRIGVEDHTTDTYEVNQIGLYSDLVLIALSEPYSLSKTNKPLYIELYCLFKGASKCSFNNIMVTIPYATTYRDGLVRFSQDNEQHKDFTVYSSAVIDDRLEYLESLLTEGIVSWKKIGDSYITGTIQLDHIELMDSVSNPTTTSLIQIDGKDNNIPRININGHIVGEIVSSTPTITQGSVLGSNKVVNETYISSLYSNVIGSSDKHKLVSSNAVQNYVSSSLNNIDSKYVHITGNENINGNKTFNGVVYSDHFKGGYDIGSMSYSFGTAGSLTYETNIVNNTADNVHIPTSLAVKNYVTTAISEIPAVDLTPYLTKVDAQNTYQVKGNYALVSQLPTKTSDLTNDSGYITIASIPKDVSAFNNDAGYLTSFTETDPTVPAWAKASNKPSYTASEVGALPDTTFIPTDTRELTNGAGFITASSLPTVNNGTLTIQKNSTTINSFTANSSSDVTVNISVPTDTGDLTNNAGYLTSSSLKTINNISLVGEGNIEIGGGGDSLIDSISVNGVTQPIEDKNVNIRVPIKVSELNNDSGFITASSLPTVNNGTLTIQKNSTTIDTFTANSSSNVTIDISVPTDTNDLTNGAGFITLSDIPTYTLDDISDGINRKLSDYVPTSRMVNSKALSSNITLNLDDVSDGSSRKLSDYVPTSRTVNSKTLSSDITLNLDDVSDGSTRKLSDYVPTSRTVNSKSLSSNITLNLDDISDGINRKLSDYVPTSRTVNRKALSSNITLNLDDVSDGTTRKLSDYVPTNRTVNSKALSSNITLNLDDISDGTNRKIPTNVSELNNDSGYLTHHQSIKTVNNESLVGTGNVNIPTGDTNVIESISVNGTAQTVTSKNVDLLFKTINGNSIEGTGNIVVGGGGTALIDSISVNGVAQPIVNKNVDITVPPVYDGTLTIQKNSTTIDTFTANSSSNVTIDISVPTDTGDLTNNAGFITSSDIPTYTLDDVLDGSIRKLSDYVPISRTVNSKALSSNITLNLDDISDGSTRKLSDYVPISRTVNSKALSSNITLNLDDISDGINRKLSDYVPTSRTVNSKALSSDITLTLDDVLDGTTRVIPTVNNGILTIQKNSITIDTFTANSSSNVTVDISVPIKVSDLTNDSGYLTTADLSNYVKLQTTSYALQTIQSEIAINTTNTSGSKADTFTFSDNILQGNGQTVFKAGTLTKAAYIYLDTYNNAGSHPKILLSASDDGSSDYDFIAFDYNNVTGASVASITPSVDGRLTTVDYVNSLLPTNYVTIDTAQEITGNKIISPTTLKIGDTTTNEDIKNYVYKRGQEFIVGTQSSETNSWTGVSEQSALYDGMCINYFLPYDCENNYSSATLNLTLSNGTTTGAKNVKIRGNNSVINQFKAGSIIQLTYCVNKTINGTSVTGWFADAVDEATNNVRLSAQLTGRSTSIGFAIYGTQLILRGSDNKFTSICGSRSTSTNKTRTTRGFYPDSIFYYSIITGVNGNSKTTKNTVWSQCDLDIRYCFNTTSLTASLPVYLVCTFNTSTSLFILDTTWWAQSLPSTEDGKYYVLLGYMSTTTIMTLIGEHPVYAYKNGAIRECHISSIISDIASLDDRVNIQGTTVTHAIEMSTDQPMDDDSPANMYLSGIPSPFSDHDEGSDYGSFNLFLDSNEDTWFYIGTPMQLSQNHYPIEFNNTTVNLYGSKTFNNTTYIPTASSLVFGSSTDGNLLRIDAVDGAKTCFTGNIAFDGTIEPVRNNDAVLGSSTNKFYNIYSTTFTGSLSGKATSADNDGSGNAINTTYARYLRTYNYSGVATSSVPTTPSYDNTPTMLGVTNASGTVTYYTGISALIANSIRGWSAIGYGSSVSDITRQTNSTYNPIGCIRMLRITRSVSSTGTALAAIDVGGQITGGTLYKTNLTSTQATGGSVTVGTVAVSVSGTWATLTYIPQQNVGTTGYYVIIAVRVA